MVLCRLKMSISQHVTATDWVCSLHSRPQGYWVRSIIQYCTYVVYVSKKVAM